MAIFFVNRERIRSIFIINIYSKYVFPFFFYQKITNIHSHHYALIFFWEGIFFYI